MPCGWSLIPSCFSSLWSAATLPRVQDFQRLRLLHFETLENVAHFHVVEIGNADAAFKAFYRAKGVVRIPPRVAYYQAKMDVEPKAVRVIELKHRWASCLPGGNLNFHWKCMMAPLTILDYIVVHELAHLVYPNHTKAFWNEVDKVMPDFQERKEWLRVNGAGMDL